MSRAEEKVILDPNLEPNQHQNLTISRESPIAYAYPVRQIYFTSSVSYLAYTQKCSIS